MLRVADKYNIKVWHGEANSLKTFNSQYVVPNFPSSLSHGNSQTVEGRAEFLRLIGH